jgi:sulfur carrier protein ThiS
MKDRGARRGLRSPRMSSQRAWPRRRPARDSETPVRVALKLYASLSDYLPVDARKTHRLELDLPAGTTIADIIEQQTLPPKMCHLVLVNGYFIPPGKRAARALEQDDELAIWPPIAGG